MSVIHAPAAPSSSRKHADRESTRKRNGRSGSPSGRTVDCGSGPIAKKATTASANPTAAPAGNNARPTNARLRGRTRPKAPIAIHAPTAARTSVSDDALIDALWLSSPQGRSVVGWNDAGFPPEPALEWGSRGRE